MNWVFRLIFIFNFFLLIPLPQGHAEQSEGVLNKLLAPGPLIKGHAKLEGSDCLKCHSVGKGISDARCLDCHKEIKPFIEKKIGFHGLHVQTCRECHSDHKGRDFDSTLVNEKEFKHKEQTGYDLAGKHSELKCEECHTLKRTKKMVRPSGIQFLGASTTCVSCHKKDDVHFFKGKWAQKDCSACHSIESWKEKITFDHSKDTKYKLEGKHAELKCNDCHTPNKNQPKVMKYQWPTLKQQQCLSCHVNVHKNTMSAKFQGGKCTTCHSQTSWKVPRFNHSVTKYKLTGKHAEIKCEECHKQSASNLTQESKKNWQWRGLKTQCLSCHKDFHRFGSHEIKKYAPVNKCSTCHNDSSWKEVPNFNHDQNTRFIVDGKHSELKCQECHLTKDAKRKPPIWLQVGIYKWQALNTKTCENCHKNVHIGVFSPQMLKRACTDCHVTEDWYTLKGKGKFDHSKARFQLTGAHKTTTCTQCHGPSGKQVFKFKNFAGKFCIDCHKTVHTGMLSPKNVAATCTVCHTTENFTKRLDFDHNTTKMPLKEAHAKLDCVKCHTPGPTKIGLFTPNVSKKEFPQGKNFQHSKFLFPDFEKKACLSCHADIHKGQLGDRCVQCHNESNWKVPKFDHNQTKFPLKDKHIPVKCSECHKPVQNLFVFEFGKSIPVVKYKNVGLNCVDCHKDVHKGQFGDGCIKCHTERGWKVTRDFHRSFTLSGVHYSLECTECHKDGRRLAGLSQQCVACHQKDDIHFGSLPDCNACHRQQFWESNRFRHSLTQFPLRGAHRTLECAECHKNGIYQGQISTCVSCHLRDATAVPTHPPVSDSTDCASCHRNQFSFGQVTP